MPLVDLELLGHAGALPADVRLFLREAERRIERFQLTSRIPAFVPSDFGAAYAALRELGDACAKPGTLFCEWGSGFGVVACLAAMLEFDACGIEIEAELVSAAQELADDFDLPVDFIQGSFVPLGGEACTSTGDAFAWFTPQSGAGHAELGLAPDDFAIIFAYPWPDEEEVTARLFERYGAIGGVLVTYRGDGTCRVRRKTRER
jgi:hypothetical protein